MTASAIPATTDAVLAVLRAVLDADQVYDGPPVQDPSETAYVIVGVSEPDDYGYQDLATSTGSWPHAGHIIRDEEFLLHCAVIGWNGDSDAKAARDAAHACLTVITDALMADPTLGGAVLFARGVSGTWRQLKDNEGTAVKILFDLACKARIS